MKKALQQRIADYAKLAGAVAAAAPIAVSAQGVYTDVEPDSTLILGDLFDVDLNGDGAGDMVLAVISNTFTYGGSAVYQNFAVASGYGAGSFAGTVQVFGGSNFYFPEAYAAGVDVDETLEWQANSAFGSMNYVTSFGGVPSYSGGNFENVSDRYLAVRFPAGTDIHFGWIRMDAGVAGPSNFITVKDYAFNAAPDLAIATGDTIGTLPSGVATTPARDLSCYAFGNNLFIRSQHNDWQQGTIEIMDMAGRNVQQSQWTGGAGQVKIRVPNGIYTAVIRTDKAVTTRKIYIGPVR